MTRREIFTYGRLDRLERRAISALNGEAVVFWDRSAEAAVVFSTSLDDQPLSFEVSSDGFIDIETGSEWRLDGLAVAGPLEGRRLAQRTEAYVSFWFAWAAFFPETFVWDGT